jgi:dTDP-glucose 4,6-dehydratase
MKKILITGGAGFIGSEFVRLAISKRCEVLVVDALTYAGDLQNLAGLDYRFARQDLRDADGVIKCVRDFAPEAVVNFAAESHVDNSISGPRVFVDTNIVGTLNLLEASRAYFQSMTEAGKSTFRFLQISTDEVFGDLGETGQFSETTPYKPHSPYSASKAGADHLVKAWHRTFKLPTLITNCSNNYGPRQFPEKLIPHMILQALAGNPLPVYGTGLNVRDWIHVEDHCAGVWLALKQAPLGSNYGFGGNAERTNIAVVETICRILDKVKPRARGSYTEQISFVTDRPGHDWRYSIDSRLAEKDLGFKRRYSSFEEGLAQTVQWYLENLSWTQHMLNKPEKSPFHS